MMGRVERYTRRSSGILM